MPPKTEGSACVALRKLLQKCRAGGGRGAVVGP